ncbi:MFS transporter [Roseateles terrae]|uniref:MFS family arabinose efflux permease n=1 Tax=Roseateles terrae TaxID=431060 RepID=A0ABR6GU10_9BURK|nr:MFS transporter [Roseateles terrae]MBB3195592.1 putative MFS family arabinose efflux permease [Roseateles terrae]OWQ86502.1 MFS transporter [Roseateles terrae]
MSATPMTSGTPPGAPVPFTPYQRFATGLLTLLQFAVILDFMIMSPLGAMIMPAMSMSAQQFGMVVSAYAFSAGLSGLLTAGFADRYDRKRLLLFFYGGFLLGTLWCGLAPSYEMLLAARVVTGLFGGVIGSIVMAITADLFPPAQRGRVMGLLQGGFAASQVLGLPFGLYLASRWSWHAPFLALVGMGLVAGLFIAFGMKPVNAHLTAGRSDGVARHLRHVLSKPLHWMAFAVTALLTTGGFMLMPFASAFSVHNVGISLDHLPAVYLVTGLSSLVVSPFIGRMSDRWGALPVFYVGCVVTVVMVLVYTHLGTSPLWLLIGVNLVMFVGIFSRLIPWQALVSGIPAPEQRGAFSAINSALQQLAGGVASLVAGHLVTLGANGEVQNFPRVGYVVITTTLTAAVLIRIVARQKREVH